MSLPAPDLTATPAQRLSTLASILGIDEVGGWCADLLGGRAGATDTGRPDLAWLGGPAAVAALARGDFEAPVHQYWLRVWAARGLLHAWTPSAAGAVRLALGDPHWRVREMAAKVVRAHAVPDADTVLEGLLDDPVTRVSIAAAYALAVVAEAECADALRRLGRGTDLARASAASQALAALGRRLDRPL